MVAGHNQRLAAKVMKWPAVAVIAAASSLYTMNHARNWWMDITDRLGLTVNALDGSGISEGGTKQPWWKSILGRVKEEIPAIPVEVMDEVLRKDEFSKPMNEGIVSGFDTNQYSANSPIEDRHIECLFSSSKSFMFGVFDGHSGYHCSETLRQRMPQYISCAIASDDKAKRKIDKIKSRSYDIIGKEHDDNPVIELAKNFDRKQKMLQTGSDEFCNFLDKSENRFSQSELLKLAFSTLDRDICKEAVPSGFADESLLIGLAGSCAIASVIQGDDLYIANTGDCRAVIGKHSSSGKWIANQITQDQTVENISEVERIEHEHPNEQKTVIRNGRLLGQLQPLRSFGDVQYKWSKELHEKVINVVYGRPVVSPFSYLTPPYLTAEPVVSHRKITDEDRFLIIATDGLWEKISSEQAVKLVGSHLDNIKKSEQEENGATLLIKYALGKGNDSALANMMSLPVEYKRHFHDDITVTVVYFNSNFKNSKL
eukprot:gene13969-4931_t